MNNNLTVLLRKYEQKRSLEISASNKLKEQIFNKYPELEKIENDIASLSIQKIQLILTSKNKQDIYSIDTRISNLKKEKKSLLDKYKIKESDFLPKFECDKCIDGFILNDKGSCVLSM